MSTAARAESTAIAERLGAIAALDALREVELAETVFWRTDPFEEVCAEVSAELVISRARARGLVSEARALAKLPLTAAMFHRGDIDYRIVKEILNRTATLADDARPLVDDALSRYAGRWSRLSDKKLRDRIDHVIANHDPDGVRIPPSVDESHYIDVAASTPGMAEIFGRLHAADGASLDTRLTALAHTVCDEDPRTLTQRRADALGALARMQTRLPCLCGNDNCPADTGQTTSGASGGGAVIYYFAGKDTLDGTSNAPGYLPKFGIQPADTIRDVAQQPDTTIKPVTHPPDQPEPHYRPSTGLKGFLYWRDLTCRWPGCDQPAMTSDLDHTTAWPYGPTHASNLKAYCRAHHLVKTFCPGWSDRQYPDGTIDITSPTGHVYRTEPHGAALFPDLATPTANLPQVDVPDTSPYRGAQMPRRRYTRAQDQQHRINTERRQRAQLNDHTAETQRQQQQWLDNNPEPPPF